MPDGMPHRRADDYVSYRDMVEYVADQEAKWHSVRAESLMQIANAIEKSEESQQKAIAKLEESFSQHELWHRQVLERMIVQGNQTRLAIYALILTALGILATIVIAR